MKIVSKKSLSIDEIIELDKDVKTTLKQSNTVGESTDTKEEFPSHEKYYLPVLNINHAQEWETKPLSERKHFTDEAAMETCLGNCCGVKGLKGACCHLDPIDLEHVLGPVDEECIKKIIKYFRSKGLNYSRQDIVIDYEEGKIIGDTLFKDAANNKIFQEREAYPILRIQALGPRYSCKFMNPQTYKCQIYEVRPKMCSTYYCNYITTNFLVKTKIHPNRWRKLR
jgi:Fe-S-cluster containining protein